MTKLGQYTGAKCRAFIEEEGCVGVYDFARATGYSYVHIYRLARMGRLGAKKRDGVWMIPKAVLEQVLTSIKGDADAG